MQGGSHEVNNRRARAGLSGLKSIPVLDGIEIVYRAVSEDTQGAYSVSEMTFPAGSGPPMHVHAREDEAWYVLDGSFDTQIGDQSYTAGPGWFGIGPRGVPHSLRAGEAGPARMLMYVTPGGFERFFDELASVLAGPPFNLDRIRATFEHHGMHILESI